MVDGAAVSGDGIQTYIQIGITTLDTGGCRPGWTFLFRLFIDTISRMKHRVCISSIASAVSY